MSERIPRLLSVGVVNRLTQYGEETCIREYSSPIAGTLSQFSLAVGDLLERDKPFAEIRTNTGERIKLVIDHSAEVIEVAAHQGMQVEIDETLLRVQDADEAVITQFESLPSKTLSAKDVDRMRSLDPGIGIDADYNPLLKRYLDGGGEGWEALSWDYRFHNGATRYSLGSVAVPGEVPGGIPAYSQGWLLSRLWRQESLILGRYPYLERLDQAGKLTDEPLPQVSWLDRPNSHTRDRWVHYLAAIDPDWRTSPYLKWQAVDYLLNWLLYGFGHPLVPTPPEDVWDGEVHSRLWQLFHPLYSYLYPYDYLGDLIESLSDDVRPIPRLLPLKKAKAWAQDLFPFKGMDNRADLVVDPQAGAGRLLLAASNHSMNLIGTETDPFLAKIAIINAYLWMPAAVYPLLCFNPELSDRQTEYALGRTLTILKLKKLGTDYFSAHEPQPFNSVYQPIQLLQKRPSLVFEGFAHTPLGIISAVKAEPPLLPTSRVEVLPPASLFDQPGLPAGSPLFGSSDRPLFGSSPLEQLPSAEPPALPPSTLALPPSDS